MRLLGFRWPPTYCHCARFMCTSVFPEGNVSSITVSNGESSSSAEFGVGSTLCSRFCRVTVCLPAQQLERFFATASVRVLRERPTRKRSPLEGTTSASSRCRKDGQEEKREWPSPAHGAEGGTPPLSAACGQEPRTACAEDDTEEIHCSHSCLSRQVQG